MKTPHIHGLLFVLSITCVASCQFDPHAHRYTTAKPLHRELVGTYVLQSETIRQADSSELNGRQCIVELKADGTFTAANVPPLNSDPGPGFVARLRSGSGKWRVGQSHALRDAPGGTISPGTVSAAPLPDESGRG